MTTAYSRVKPTKSLWPLGSFPCEIKAADITNKTFLAIDDGNAADICYRYWQTRKGQSRHIEKIFFNIVVIFCMTISSCDYLFNSTDREDSSGVLNLLMASFFGLMAVMFILMIPPAVANAFRYGMVKNYCEQWILKNKGSELLSKIKKLDRGIIGLYKLCDLIREENLPEPASRRMRAMANEITL